MQAATFFGVSKSVSSRCLDAFILLIVTTRHSDKRLATCFLLLRSLLFLPPASKSTTSDLRAPPNSQRIAMTKRRRERDKPKAGPDAPYNPHKRVHLSYGDEDEPDEDATALEQPPPIRYPTVSAHEPSPSSARTSVGPQEEAAKPTDTDDDEYDPAIDLPASTPDSSEKSKSTRQKPNAHPGKNEATNQKPALGSLSYQWEGSDNDDEESMSEEDEAMAYLKAVRTERQGMPTVLRTTESQRETVDYSVGDSRGYYVDDCYIARPILRPEAPKKTKISAKEAYTEVLKRRFNAMRTRLRDEPKQDGKETQSGDSKPVPQPNGGKNAYAECAEMVQTMPPSPAQLRALDQEDTLSMLELIQKHCFKRGETLRPNVSAWIWALLAKLDDVGTMNNDEVFVLRDLGKRALVIQISFNNAAMAAQLEDISRTEAAWDSDEANTSQHEGQHTAANADAVKTDTAGSTVTQMLDPENTLATLDMIVTIVGEFFGQRDLLDSRRSWDPEEA